MNTKMKKWMQSILRRYPNWWSTDAALIDPDAVGCDMTAFVAIILERPGYRNSFLAKIADMAEVQECHHVAGDDDYLLKVRCTGTRDLERVVSGD